MNDQVSEQQDDDTHRRLYKLIIGNERLEYLETNINDVCYKYNFHTIKIM